jgi:hypothetical protein
VGWYLYETIFPPSLARQILKVFDFFLQLYNVLDQLGHVVLRCNLRIGFGAAGEEERQCYEVHILCAKWRHETG